MQSSLDIPADDLARAQRFYSECFGWKINAVPALNYTLVITGPMDESGYKHKETGFINGGMFKRNGPVKSPVITINVEDLDAAFKKIEQAGGKIQRDASGNAKLKVSDMGFAAYFVDTEGNIVGLWQSAQPAA